MASAFSRDSCLQALIVGASCYCYPEPARGVKNGDRGPWPRNIAQITQARCSEQSRRKAVTQSHGTSAIQQ